MFKEHYKNHFKTTSSESSIRLAQISWYRVYVSRFSDQTSRRSESTLYDNSNSNSEKNCREVSLHRKLQIVQQIPFP